MDLAQFETSLLAEPLTQRPDLRFPHLMSGKVREIYDLGDFFLILSTDRVSAFNRSLSPGISGKGILLTQISLFWFHLTHSLAENHIVPDHQKALQHFLKDYPSLIPRAMIVKKLTPIPIEAIVRSYLMGNGWNNYQETGQLYGQALPQGLKKFDKLPSPLFTPTNKDATDTPLTEKEAQAQFGEFLLSDIKETSLKLFDFASNYAKKAELTLVDTKFEFGLDSQNNLILMDEVFTPDSSRYWAIDDPGKNPIDKQFIRDFLLASGWDQNSSPPELPEVVVGKTQERYLKLYQSLVSIES